MSHLPPAEFTDLFAFGFIFNLPNDKRVEQFCDYLLENYIDTDSNNSSVCVVRMICPIIEDHKRMWAFPCLFQYHISQCASEYFCFFIRTTKIQNEVYIKMRSVTTRRFKRLQSKKRISFSQRFEYRNNLISRVEFVSSVSFTFLPNSSLLLAFTMPLATSATVHIVGQNNRYYARQSTAS